jgi:DNA-binding transcriptional MerR regulator
MRQYYSISELTREFSITARTIRFYEEQGLITPLREGRKRLFSVIDRRVLRQILRGKSLGLTVDELKQFVTMYQEPPNREDQLNYMVRILQENRTQLRQKRKNIEDIMSDLEKAEEKCIEKLAELRVNS